MSELHNDLLGAAAAASTLAERYDAILLVSFGGPENPDEVVDFLEVVTKGSGIPRERLAVVGEHYFLFGGKSPINDQNKALMAALREELTARGISLPIYWGNRNWHPFIDEAIRQLRADGHRRVLMLTTSAYPSYSGCRSYREAVAEALEGSGAGIEIDRIGNYGLDGGFVEANAAALASARAELPGARTVFVTHSIPTDMDASSGPEQERGAYTAWHREVAARVFERTIELEGGQRADAEQPYDLVYCSRSGRPGQPWLEPDINDHLRALHRDGVDKVVLMPIGFISDHMEVIYDLDTQARETCTELGIQMVRGATAGTSPAFVAALVDRMVARAVQPAGCTPAGCGGLGCCPNLRHPATSAIA